MLACPDARGSRATIYHLDCFGNEDRAGSGKHGVRHAINALHELLTARWSWETLLKPHLRAAEQPTQHVEVVYGPASGKLDVYARCFRELRFLEPLVEHLVHHFAWPKPLVMEMQSCGEIGANWRSRRLKLCYEMAEDFAELNSEYGGRLKQLKPATPLPVRSGAGRALPPPSSPTSRR
jgi:hypothetical protein